MAKGGRRKSANKPTGGANRGRQQPRQRSQAGRTSKPAQSPTATKAEIEKAHEEAVAGATESEVAALSIDPRPPELHLDDMWKMAQEARDLFRAAKKRHDVMSEDLQTQRDDVGRKSQELDERTSKLETDKTDLDERTSQLGEREVEIREREADAERGFENRRSAMLAQYDDVIAKRRETLDERENVLNERENELEQKARQIARQEKQLQWSQDDLEEQERDLNSRVERLIAGQQEEHQHRLSAVEAQRDQARQDRDQHATAMQQREEADRGFGQRSPDQVLAELDQLKRENEDLLSQLAARPDADAIERLAFLDQEQQSWQAERLELTREVSTLKRRLAHADGDAGEREVQRDRIAALDSQRKLLHRAHEELRAEVDEIISRGESQSQFPACVGMDKDGELQRAAQTEEDFGSLREFAQNIRHRIAQEGLYYTEADIRSFIGGLAMGRLTLLQGISGTGKTSLPIAFAKAVGTHTRESVVEVQAGWRDPQDLVGHYNAFDKQFYEGKFLQALYRAGTPRWKDTIQIVLLDEMNLSHPEQYFSGMLSALELPREGQRLELMPHTEPPAPLQLRDGKWLPIPPNVWFVGTANHDETTMDFADKTYDRSHVMEFPHKPEGFDAGSPEPRHPVSFRAFQDAFEAAVKEHAKQAEQVQDHFDKHLRDLLANRFEIGWGPRLGRQIKRYVPVVIAAGGTVGEAADHILAMRLLRKLKNRHNNRPEHLEDLKQTIVDSWEELEKHAPPAKSIPLLDAELQRVGRDGEGAT